MQVVIAGSGEVGYRVARDLGNRGHGVTVIDSDTSACQRTRELDVQVVQGNAAIPQVLVEESHLANADLFIGVTGQDEINLLCCSMAKAFNIRTIVRLNNLDYVEQPSSLEQFTVFGVDAALCPDDLAARRIWHLLSRHSLTNLEIFEKEKIRLFESRISERSPVVGQTLEDVHFPESAVPVALYRGEAVIIPTPKEVLMPRDRLLSLLTRMEAIPLLMERMGQPHELTLDGSADKVMIAGATRVGLEVARRLTKRYKKLEIMLIEEDETLCSVAADSLSDRVLILHGSPTDRKFIEDEGIRNVTHFVAVTANEELNVVAALMAKRQGAKRTVALTYKPELEYALEDTSIDVLVNPLMATYSAILNHATSSDDGAAFEALHTGEAVARVLPVKEGAPLIGRPLGKVKMPSHSILGALLREEQGAIVDRSTPLNEGDRGVIFCLQRVLPEVERLFG